MKNLVCKFVVWLFLVVFFFCNTAMAEMDDSLDPVARLTALIIETKYAAAEELYQSEIKGSILLEVQAAEAVKEDFLELIDDCKTVR